MNKEVGGDAISLSCPAIPSPLCPRRHVQEMPLHFRYNLVLPFTSWCPEPHPSHCLPYTLNLSTDTYTYPNHCILTMSARASVRVSLRWLPDPPFENTKTLALNCGDYYVDLRTVIADGSIEWGMAGKRLILQENPCLFQLLLHESSRDLEIFLH
jgi:hypothetical protein